jgi:membrane-associated phospholipid phosphatase
MVEEHLFSLLTDPIFIAGAFISALLLHRFFHKKERLLALILFSLLVFAVSSIFVIGLKDYFAIPRPCAGEPGCPTDYSFPSGHATTSFALFSFIFFLNSRWRASEIILAFPFLISLLRIVQGVHTVVDVTAGAAIGTFIGLAFASLHAHSHKFEEAVFRRQSGMKPRPVTRAR